MIRIMQYLGLFGLFLGFIGGPGWALGWVWAGEVRPKPNMGWVLG